MIKYLLSIILLSLLTIGLSQTTLIQEKTKKAAENLEKSHPAGFYEKATKFYKDSLKDDAAFLFYLGQLRYRYYLKSCPKVKKGEGQVLGALNATVGQVINEYLADYPDRWVEIIDLVLSWDSTHEYKYYQKSKDPKSHEGIIEGLNKLKLHIIENKEELLSRNKTYFTIKIEQEGIDVPIENHIVELKKSSFRLTLKMNGISELLLTCNKTEESYNLFKKSSINIKDIPAYQNTGMAETNFNVDKYIVVCSDAPSSWFYQDTSFHRFNKITFNENTIIGERVIEYYADCDEDKYETIDKINGNLYLTFLHSKEGEDELDRIPLQKEYFMIKWK